ncbi:MAG TPA: hypothetical protein EYP78_06250, partial [Candidatus Omnitrophica bacterium]|nr:hypothetical protein [Candidatus Omnitrophota bacterium]
VLAVVVIVILSTFLVPVFADLFTEFDAELPFLTRMLIASRKFSPHFWLMVVFIIAVLFGVYKLFTRTIGGKLLRDRLKLKLPIIGPIHLRIVSSRFARTFATLINSGVPILDSLSIARDAAGNEVVALDLDLIRNGVEKGQTLETSLRESTSFPPLLMDMVTVGEQAGNLGEVLTYTANIYDEEVNSILSNLITIIEPFLVLGMGILVALVLYSFFIPYIDLLTAVGQL